MTLSPDGKWLWNGQEWIPAPPNHSPTHHIPVHSSHSDYGNSEGKMKNTKYRKPKPFIAIFVASLIIFSTIAVGGYLMLSYLEEKEIEGTWNLEDGGTIEFKSDNKWMIYDEGTEVYADSITSWTVDNGLLTLQIDDSEFTSIDIYQYSVNNDYLYLGKISSVIIEDGEQNSLYEYNESYNCQCYILWRPNIQPTEMAVNANAPSWFSLSSLSSDQPEAGILNDFDAEDASEFLSSATDDTMIRISWTYADDNLNWAFLSFKLEKGDEVFNCKIATNADSADCLIQQTGNSDTQWETDEIVYIKENGFDLCTQSCDLEITVQYNGQVLSGTNSVFIS